MSLYKLKIAMIGREQGLEILADRREVAGEVVRYLNEDGTLVAEVPAVIINDERIEA